MRIVLFVLLAFLSASSGWAGQRLALVFGNADYTHLNKLVNADDDANAVASLFGELGFQVSAGIDVNEAEFRKQVADFAVAAKGADVVALFYAGHGTSANDDLYLLPTDFNLEPREKALATALTVNGIIRTLQSTGATVLAFVDTNRSPFGEGNAPAGVAGQPSNVRDAGTFMSFSTSPGGIALDGKGKHSPYTEALLKHLPTPGIDIEKLASRIRNDVYSATDGQQSPFENSTLRKALVLKAK